MYFLLELVNFIFGSIWTSTLMLCRSGKRTEKENRDSSTTEEIRSESCFGDVRRVVAGVEHLGLRSS